ncbi:hypothetical protein HPT25_26420 [Bacillus sp. BRMEA1]|uniref:hypothetical protein n=1 Tax=Neobacillus endophyticus TaxID=2738405 RepID=UPI0015654EDD|nr:hypothetical protein [Neobacillus endophyticus]NRD80867.1 hypothetical protein [Neobacillus endophyticus]
MLDTVYVDIRHMDFWFGHYGLIDKSWNDEVKLYSDANKTNDMGYFEISTHTGLAALYNNLDDKEDYEQKKEIEDFLNGETQVYYSYLYPRYDEDLLDQVSHFAPLNKFNHKPIYIDMWTKLSEKLDINEIKNCVRILVKKFFHENVSNIVILEIPTYEETKKDYDEIVSRFK